MSRESRAIEQLDQAVELATRCILMMPAAFAVARAEAATFHLGAQSFDGVRVSGFTTELDDDDHPIPVRSDPVGKHVAEGLDNYDQTAERIISAARAINTEVEQLAKLLQPLGTAHHRAVTPKDELAEEAKEAALEEARLTRENDPCCRSCLRADVRAPVAKRRSVDGDTWALCRWCYDFTREVGKLPTRDEVAEHHAGGKVRRRVAP